MDLMGSSQLRLLLIWVGHILVYSKDYGHICESKGTRKAQLYIKVGPGKRATQLALRFN